MTDSIVAGIPNFQSLMLPLLRFASDGREIRFSDAVDALGAEFKLTPAQMAELWPSAKYPRFRGRVSWAKTYLTKAMLIGLTDSGQFKITKRGVDLIATNPTQIDRKLLSQFPEFLEFVNKRGTEEPEPSPDPDPYQRIEDAITELDRATETDLLEAIKKASWSFFQDLVVDLFIKMGYGTAETARVVGRSGDGGIDGVIPRDPLNVDVIYLQTKRYSSMPVGSAAVREFAGSLGPHKVNQGVIVTSSTFSSDAKAWADTSPVRIILIDGESLVRLMLKHGVGVRTSQTYAAKSIDINYFEGV